jgi:hypothetical protein
VDVPIVSERDDGTAPPTRSAPVEVAAADDLLSYYVDTWDGMVNGTFPTELRIDSAARFFINLKPNPKLASCHLAGRVRPTDSTLTFEIEESTCKAEQPGAKLVRRIVAKTERELELANEDSSLTIRYTRRAR